MMASLIERVVTDNINYFRGQKLKTTFRNKTAKNSQQQRTSFICPLNLIQHKAVLQLCSVLEEHRAAHVRRDDQTRGHNRQVQHRFVQKRPKFPEKARARRFCRSRGKQNGVRVEEGIRDPELGPERGPGIGER